MHTTVTSCFDVTINKEYLNKSNKDDIHTSFYCTLLH